MINFVCYSCFLKPNLFFNQGPSVCRITDIVNLVPINFNICQLIPVNVRYNLEIVATMQSLPVSPYVHLKHINFLPIICLLSW